MQRVPPHTETYSDWEILTGRSAQAKKKNRAPLGRYSLFLVQHVLDDLLPLLQVFIDLGCDPKYITVVGIPYSSLPAAGDRIKELGCRVILPPVFPFDGYIHEFLMDHYLKSVKAKKRLIIIEDGGYVVPLVSQLVLMGKVDRGKIAGAVEQTARGAWLDEEVNWGGHLQVPVVAIPMCITKNTVEPPYIASAVQRNLRQLLQVVVPTRQLRTVGVFGHGTIGAMLADYYAKQEGAKVYVRETDPSRREIARAKYDPLSSTKLGSCDLVIGSTGSTSIDMQTIDLLGHNTVLASTSSRRIEIDIRGLSSRAVDRKPQPIGPPSPCVLQIPAGRRFDYYRAGSGGRSLYLLYDGYPINFSGRSLPDYVSDAILALLLEGALAIAGGNLQASVIYPGNRVISDADREIYRYWAEFAPDDNIYPRTQRNAGV